MDYKHEISLSEAKYFINTDKKIETTKGNQQLTYNMPSEFFNYCKENNILEYLYDSEVEVTGKMLYKLNSEYSFKLGEGVIWLLGNEFSKIKNNFFILQASNGKAQIFRSYYSKKDKVGEVGFKWFHKLYDKNLSGNTLIINLDTNNKILILDIKFNSIKFDIDINKIMDIEVNNLNKEEINYINKIDAPYNLIVFGAPGTGKSYGIKKFIDENKEDINYERVTFNPNTSYAQFVGSYKPKFDRTINQITYSFVPGPFLRILANSIKDKTKNYVLVIEEINRANVSAVFGDIFQLLDRKDDGESQYEISTSEDIKDYLINECEFNKVDAESLKIPSNMYIWATMNSADQGVMPIDTAFKRRWNFEYIGVNDGREIIKDISMKLSSYKEVAWNNLREEINTILIENNINDDKLIGPFFLSKKELKSEFIDEVFKSKVLMYLFQDVVKHNKNILFNSELNTYSKIVQAYENGDTIFVDSIKLEKEIKFESVAESSNEYISTSEF